VEWSRGESAFLIEGPYSYLAQVVEGLGTKNLVADELGFLAREMDILTGRSYYDNVAQDCVAMIVNDMITSGAMPLVLGMYLGAGSSDWFNNESRYADLIKGWENACYLSRCAWGGGETPTLREIIYPTTVDLAGSAIGIVSPKNRLIDPKNIKSGDAIVMIQSSGIHANGLTLAREIASKLENGFLTKTSDGRSFGESLLDPTTIYVPLVDDCLNIGVDIHYAVNITGHGWRKLMRAEHNFSYIINKMIEPQPVFNFIQEHGPVSIEEMYANFNMGVGFALYVDPCDVSNVVEVASTLGMGALWTGHVEKSDQKKVIIKPLGIEFLGSSLEVR
jgi:phosphoribosylformylglycinamidine cyclo-ligase